MGKTNNRALHKAKAEKNDEFYTRLVDVEKELYYYQDQFKNKVVLCNCDDPDSSNFFKYFTCNFERLELKKLIVSCYKSNPEKGIYLEYAGNRDGKRPQAIEKTGIKHLQGNGDFRSAECIELLKQADIIVTNPPFSLFKEYITQLIKYKKKFLIIGNKNAINYRYVFSLIKNNLLWLGHRGINKDFWFNLPDDCKNYEKIIDGKKTKHIMATWFTNLETKKRTAELPLFRIYKGNARCYPKYGNYKAIEVDKIAKIPQDYKGVMGVPITFLDKYNPNQFEIVNISVDRNCKFTGNKKMSILDKDGQPIGKCTMNGKGALYRKFNPKIDKHPSFKEIKTGKLYSSVYTRILIKHKKVITHP